MSVLLRVSCRIRRSSPNVAFRLNRGRSLSTEKADRSVSIQDVNISSVPQGSGRPDLVPELSDYQRLWSVLPPSFTTHLRWMLQKDLALHQDFCLLGPPELANDRRSLAFLYASLLEREVEYVSLSRDTSDADLKQRKEVVQGGRTAYIDQAPVRAAINGRLLILDGLEKAERNVLPTLNNLLENREMSLDDGSMLVSSSVFDQHKGSVVDLKIQRVHPDFRVAALGSLGGAGSALDPPLRSRFQARLQMGVNPGELLEAMVKSSNGELDESTIKELVHLITAPDAPGLSLTCVLDATRYLVEHQSRISPEAALNAHGMGMVRAQDIEGSTLPVVDSKDSFFVATPTTNLVLELCATGINSGRAVACVGPKGCGKSAIASQLAKALDRNAELFSLFKDMTSRDLLLTRRTDEAGNTVWQKTPLTRAVENGTMVMLDGIDKLSGDTLSSISRLMEQREVDLPDGTRLKAHADFACVALAHPPANKSAKNWITPEVAGMFYWIEVEPLPTAELETVLSNLFPGLDPAQLDAIVRLRDRLDEAIASGAADTMDEKESLVLSLRKMKHLCKRVGRSGSDLSQLVRDALVTSLMPDREQQIVETCMADCGIYATGDKREGTAHGIELDKELLDKYRRTPSHPLLVPNPHFEENPGHAAVLRDILDAHSVGERALLVMGYQGVGKNRVVDFLLHRLQCEREYLQLHRDTTAQSLLASPSVEDGRLVFEDSPLVRAAINGRILVLDEADKAPVEVVALLKGLIEDGELALPDGRVLRYDESISVPGQTSIVIHKDFRLWALANPAGYPFHGNDLAKEMADVFSCHTVPALDPESQARILKSYGRDLSDKTIQKIILIWQDLIKAHQKGVLAYPFSIREAVSVARHLSKYPDDGLDGAIENVIAFDRFDTALMNQLGSIFKRHGVRLPAAQSSTEFGGGRDGGISTPKTRTSDPKHGKEDPNNEPHVGGNTWAGGTGGSDTAGLGGRGGPYRLDLGHKVHQVSDEMKAQVSEEAQQRARAMADAALKEKLRELKMGKGDWDRYDNLRQRVEAQIQQLRVHLKDIKRRKEERVWLRRQSTGELDDSRIVDALAGEKDVFKRRGVADQASSHGSDEGEEPMSITLVVDVSASMYRFNSYDGRLERLLEATLMLMEAVGEDERFNLQIVGHNGSSARIPLVTADTPNDPAHQLAILEGMVAHTQYTYAGDSTLEAIELAVGSAKEDELVLIISDANLERYRIEPFQVASLLQRSDVHAHLILIGSMGGEAAALAKAIPNGRAQVCANSEELPLQLKNIIASVTK